MRRYVRALTVIATLMVSLVVPAASDAASIAVGGNTYTQVSDYRTYTGWARLGAYSAGGYEILPLDCVDCDMRGAYHAASVDFSGASSTQWRWTGAQWAKQNVALGTWMWVQPYAVGWSWAWTAQTGWVAVQDRGLFVAR
jgi:hypothetical protein